MRRSGRAKTIAWPERCTSRIRATDREAGRAHLSGSKVVHHRRVLFMRRLWSPRTLKPHPDHLNLFDSVEAEAILINGMKEAIREAAMAGTNLPKRPAPKAISSHLRKKETAVVMSSILQEVQMSSPKVASQNQRRVSKVEVMSHLP